MPRFASATRLLMHLPFFYGWVIVAVALVTMGIGFNVRTAFSPLFPPILDEFGWERGVTAGAFSFGFLVSAGLSPLLGRLMDHRGPRLVIEMGVGFMAAGMFLATLASLCHPRRAGWRRQCVPVLFRSIAVPAELVRAPAGLGNSLAFLGVGVGSITLLPWVQA
jgi:MFS family permease